MITPIVAPVAADERGARSGSESRSTGVSAVPAEQAESWNDARRKQRSDAETASALPSRMNAKSKVETGADEHAAVIGILDTAEVQQQPQAQKQPQSEAYFHTDVPVKSKMVPEATVNAKANTIETGLLTYF